MPLEYQEHSEPLSGHVYRITGYVTYGVPATTEPGGMNLAQDIEQSISRLLARIVPRGWEPMEPTDPDSLWDAKHVEMSYKKKMFSSKYDMTAVAVRVRCRRQTP